MAEEEAPRSFRARGVAELVGAVARPAFRARSPATASLLTDWGAIVGPALAARTEPRRLAGGTLTIACEGPVALELQHLSGALLARIEAHLGERVVSSLRFVQAPVAPAAERPAARKRQAPAAEAQPVDGVNGELGAALGRLLARLRG